MIRNAAEFHCPQTDLQNMSHLARCICLHVERQPRFAREKMEMKHDGNRSARQMVHEGSCPAGSKKKTRHSAILETQPMLEGHVEKCVEMCRNVSKTSVNTMLRAPSLSRSCGLPNIGLVPLRDSLTLRSDAQMKMFRPKESKGLNSFGPPNIYAVKWPE